MSMTTRPWDRERALALIWLAGALLTALTLVLPYDVMDDDVQRTVVAFAALGCGIALWLSPPLPGRALHGVLVLGTVTISYCTSLGVADIEGVMYLLPVLFAFAAFRPLLGAAHLALNGAAYALVLATASDEHTIAPWISGLLVIGVGAVTGASIAILVASRERALEAGRRDRRIAEVLQRSLLPDALPNAPGIELAARYVPAAQEADVGGDLYDVIALPGGRIALAIGDVAGKGLPAAAMVGRTRSALRAYTLDDPAPARVLDRLNRLMVSDPTPARMTTLLYAVLDPVAGRLTWSTAGHLPPLMLGATGETRLLDGAGGVPLGVVPLARYDEGSTTFAPGDRLLLYTDGLVERRGVAIDEALDAFAAHVAAAPDTGAAGLIETALGALSGPLRDDVAVLAVVLTPLGDELHIDVPSRPEALGELRVALRRWAEPRLHEDAVEDALLACSEVVANAIMHAGPSEIVAFEARCADGGVRFCVRDTGRWRPAVDDGHGRGLTLAAALSDRLDVRAGDPGTIVELEFGGARVRTDAAITTSAPAR